MRRDLGRVHADRRRGRLAQRLAVLAAGPDLRRVAFTSATAAGTSIGACTKCGDQ